MRLFLSPHRRWRRLLEQWESGALDERDLPWFEEHRRTCGRCAREAAELALVRELLAELPEVDAPRSFRLREPVVLPSPARPGVRVWAARGLVAAATAAAVAAGVFLALAVREPSSPQAEPVPQFEDVGVTEARTAEPTPTLAAGTAATDRAATAPDTGVSEEESPEPQPSGGREAVETPEVSAAGETTPPAGGYIGPEGRLASPPPAVTEAPAAAPAPGSEPDSLEEAHPGIAAAGEDRPTEPASAERALRERNGLTRGDYLVISLGAAALALVAAVGAVILRRVR